ncbi:MAG TPA: response regulator transcription factor, partial [Aquabacterium sp.]|nr:response regulator transcription factor [Aquabacterium sp.]
HSVFEVRKSLALEIEIEMAAARDAEKDFLIQRQEHFAEEVDQHLQVMRAKVTALAAVDQHSRQTAEQLQRLLTTYQESFRTVAEAWRSIGLDENSGIQGAFRQKVHRLQELSAQYYVDPLYTILLQIRRSEKDLALRKGPAYRDRVRKLIQEFRQLVQGSGLQATVKQNLLSELVVYARTFEPYADNALKSAEVGGGMGPFRDAAHRIEAILKAHHVPHLETNIYKLRRHEKDFLLRGDEAYATMLVEMARTIRSQIAASPLSETDKTLLASLLLDYQQGFLLLVAQRASIVTLTREVDAAARQIAPLITANVDQANQMMAARVEALARRTRPQAPHPLQAGQVQLDFDHKVAKVGGQMLNLTAMEWTLLSCLAAQPGHTLSRQQIRQALFNPGRHEAESNSLEVIISRLRRKLGPDLISTHRGLGYRLDL